MVSQRLRTQLEIAIQRAKDARREEWSRRFDPAAWRCRREGNVWFAEGPCGSLMAFRKDEDGATVLCLSSSGSEYRLAADEEGRRSCDCPHARAGNSCKHLAAWRGVKQAAAMARELGGAK
jgi:hypothetical protein